MAGPTRAAGHPDYSSSGTVKFIPEIWSGKLAPKWYKTTVFGSIANTDYEGEVRNKGDKVQIRLRPTITISDYEVGGGLTYEKPTSTAIQLELNRAKYFGVECNDVDRIQSDLQLMDEFSDDASEQMQITIDSDVLGGIYSSASATNAGATAGTISSSYNLGTAAAARSVTSSNILHVIAEHGAVLDEANVPQTGRWIVIPVWMCYRVKVSDLKDASLAGDGTSIFRNGRLGMLDRFEVYMSNNLNVSGSNTDIIAGHKQAVTFASQITQVETLKNPNDFGDIVRGLNVYGYKVVNGDGITHGVVTPG